MHAIEKIKKKLIEDSHNEKKKIIENAGKVADTILKKNLEVVNREIENLNRKLDKDITMMENRIISSARIDAKRIIHRTKDEIINECVNGAKEKLMKMDADDKMYFTFLCNSLKKGITSLRNIVSVNPDMSNVIIATEEKNINTIKKIISDMYPGNKIVINTVTDTNFGGVIVSDAEGLVKIDYTFDTLLDREKYNIRREVSKILFGG